MIEIQKLYDYVGRVRQQKKVDIHSIINTTLVSNPYITNFPKDFLFNNFKKESKLKLFIMSKNIVFIKNFIRHIHITTSIYIRQN